MCDFHWGSTFLNVNKQSCLRRDLFIGAQQTASDFCFENITGVLSPVCWPIPSSLYHIQLPSSHHTDLQHCWLCCICRGMGTPALIPVYFCLLVSTPYMPFCCYSWFCFGTFRTNSQVTRDGLSPRWLFSFYRTMQLQQHTGQRPPALMTSIISQFWRFVLRYDFLNQIEEGDSLSSHS